MTWGADVAVWLTAVYGVYRTRVPQSSKALIANGFRTPGSCVGAVSTLLTVRLGQMDN